MKKTFITTLLAILMGVCMAFGLTACNDKECKHTYDNACDATCNKCEETREITHTPEEDDGDCTTAVQCAVCEQVLVEAKSTHTPEEDDGDCTTAVKCLVCDEDAVASYPSHSSTDTDDNWTCDNLGCQYLLSGTLDGMVFVPNEDGESYCVTGLAEGFEGTVLNIPASCKGLPVTAIGDSAFAYCESLVSVTLPDSVTTIGDSAFVACYSLTSVTLPDSLTAIGNRVFYSCYSLTSVTIPDSVTAIGESAFFNCTDLTSVIFGENSELTTIGYQAFYACYSLTSVTIPAFVTEIGEKAFEECGDSISVYYDGTKADWTTLSANAGISTSATVYCWSEGLEFGEIKGENGEVVGYSVIGMGTCTDTILRIPAAYNGKPVTAIGDSAFSKYIGAMLNPNLACAALTSVTIPNSVVTIGESAFYDCESLTSVTISASVVTIGGHAFQSCNALASVTFGKNSRLTTIGRQVFNWCESLTSVTLPASVTSIGVSVFTMSSVTSVYFGGTQDEWAEVEFDSPIPDTVTVYYYSETQPEGEGNYWHYDTNGVPTTEWDD